MPRLTSENKDEFWRWIFHEVIYPFSFLVAAFIALYSFGVSTSFKDTFATPDCLLLAGLVFLGLFSELRIRKVPTFGWIPPQGLPNTMHLVSLGLLFAYLVMKVRLAIRIPVFEKDGTYKGVVLIFQPQSSLGWALLVLLIVTFIICANIKLKSLLLK
jgi:hypothetical protein